MVHVFFFHEDFRTKHLLLGLLQIATKILLSATLLAQQCRQHLISGHFDLSEWGLLEFALEK